MASKYMDGPFFKVWDEAQKKGLTLGKEKASRDWLMSQAKRTTVGDNPIQFVKDYGRDFKRRDLRSGFMYFYSYSPKFKDDPTVLPYYDSYPLVFILEEYEDRYLTINLHYLNHPMRARLLDALYTIATNKKFNDNQKISASYGVLKASARFKWFKACLKYHLKGHITSNFYKIPSEFWSYALFLPLEKFNRKSKTYVWKESAKIIAKG